ncbi:MAG: ABC transporter permease [Anaerolineae bacterium]|jgi:peptide/nickel transport system permease protein|uniref:ABC transporter permease n=1 Tax=Candidatus Flexifilum breve TaxID=3140694 RepID=UPI001ACDC84F|nr:ABC transporter permease [Chloroflexota bacterium]MBK9745553.1 ABC transporter permease [Chloroflexota bacterium]MBN8635115.1 ABC transporter permease [Anaerolineae bacterium]
MQNYLVRRLLQMIPVFIGITFISFAIVRLSPGDPVATLFPPEVLGRIDQELLREQLGLNDPLPVQYVKMMVSFFNGSLNSFQERRPTSDILFERLPITLLFATTAVLLALLIGLPVAVISALRPNSWLDNVFTTAALAGISIPSFWIALVFILIFTEQLRWLPASGIRPITATGYNLVEMLPYMIMPSIVLSLSLIPSIVRYTRSSMLEVMTQDYVRTARSKGLAEQVVVIRHGLRNALLPVVSLIGAIFPVLLGGMVLVESIFALPGLGRLAVRAAQTRDYPMILTLNMFSAVMVLLSNTVTDLIYQVLDPRIRLN